MNSTATLVTAVGGAIGVIVGAWAVLVRARGEAAKPKLLLHRLWDWIETMALHEEVPRTLAAEIRDEIEGDPK